MFAEEVRPSDIDLPVTHSLYQYLDVEYSTVPLLFCYRGPFTDFLYYDMYHLINSTSLVYTHSFPSIYA